MPEFPQLTADEAAATIQNGQTIGFSGFTAAGSVKAVPLAIAARARAFHQRDEPFQINVITGASTGPSLDGALARENAIHWRTPYQSDPDLRKSINDGHTIFFDMHLSQLPAQIRQGVLGPIDVAIVEAADVAKDGSVVLTTSVGATPTFLDHAKRVIIELNRYHPPELRGIHDIYQPAAPPFTQPIPLLTASDRIGSEVVRVDPRKIIGIVETNLPNESKTFTPASDITGRIGAHVADFLAAEMRRGLIPGDFLPLQSGVGNTANSVLAALGGHPAIPAFTLYSEVLQDAVIELIDQEQCRFASATSLTLSQPLLQQVYRNLDHYRSRFVLRPQEITNHPEIIRRLGIIAVNTAIEVDVFGNVNSTHVLGQKLMNGIGGSGDFTRNAYLSIFVCPSTAKDSCITTIVPACSHMDHSEHSVHVVVTEHGVADLRGKDPRQRAEAIIRHCADPQYREALWEYFHLTRSGHLPQSLDYSYSFHKSFLESGDMRHVHYPRQSP
jgi:acetyl-CoA hydrolase